MKAICTLLVAISMLLLENVCYGQTTKSGFLLGGLVSFSHQQSNTDPKRVFSQGEATVFGLSVKGGYFLLNNVAIGLESHYFTENRRNRGETISDHTTIKGYRVYPFVRYYVRLTDKVRLMAHANISSYEHARSHTTTKQLPMNSESLYKQTIESHRIGLAPGVVYFITDHIGLEVLLGSFTYSAQKIRSNSIQEGLATQIIERTKNFNSFFNPPPMSGSTTLSLGLQFYLH